MCKRLFLILALTAATVAQAADPPDVVYQAFHAAAITKNFTEASKYASSFTAILVRTGEDTKMPLKALIPKSYVVVATQISGDGRSATLSLEGEYEFASGTVPDAKGTIGLVKEGGHWKVDNGGWRSR